MDKIIDFTNAPVVPRQLGGSDRKFRVLYENRFYMLKFTENHIKRTDLSTSHENNAISEYISSHISQSIGLETHNTVLGLYNGDICVACEDFRDYNEENLEFANIARTIYAPKEFNKIPRLDQLYEIYNCASYPEELRKAGIERYWETFIVDALVGNFDRHAGNWGLIIKPKNMFEQEYRLAPVYDFGSTLFPVISDEGVEQIINNEFELLKRCLVFPSPDLYILKEKAGKAGYYDMLSSDYDENCTKALLKIFPQINMRKIESIIDETPFITDIKKDFYKKIIELRYSVILEKSYDKCVSQNYDKEAFYRLKNGISFDVNLLQKEMNNSGIYTGILNKNNKMAKNHIKRQHSIDLDR